MVCLKPLVVGERNTPLPITDKANGKGGGQAGIGLHGKFAFFTGSHCLEGSAFGIHNSNKGSFQWQVLQAVHYFTRNKDRLCRTLYTQQHAKSKQYILHSFTTFKQVSRILC